MNTKLILLGIGIVLLGMTITLSAGCKMKSGEDGDKTAKSGSELWSENCQRCHNMRDPAEFSDAQWEVVGHHMRVRANLTANEHKSIVEFLKAGN